MTDLDQAASQLAALVGRMDRQAAATSVWRAQTQLEELRLQVARSTPRNPAAAGWGSYSQCDEDGIIRDCLLRIEKTEPLSRTFIEIGCGNGLENNTHQLLLDGFSGGWLDGDEANISFIAAALANTLPTSDRLSIRQVFIDTDNVAEEVEAVLKFIGTRDIDFYSLDTDGNDIHLVVQSLTVFRPKLVCVEYNAKFRPPTRLQISYDAHHNWSGDDYFGASLQAWVDSLGDYTLVACNLSGANAFLVRSDLMQGFEQYPVEDLYQPPRYWLASHPGGHPSGFRWLRQTLG